MDYIELERPLDSIESHLTSRFAFVFVISGSIKSNALNEAFHALCLRHPVLRSRISIVNENQTRLLRTTAPPEVKVIDSDKSSWQSETSSIENESNPRTFVPLLVCGKQICQLVLNFSHAIADAHAAFTYMAELWTLYAKIIDRNEVEYAQSTRLPLPPTKMVELILNNETKSPMKDRGKKTTNQRQKEESSVSNSAWAELIKTSTTETDQFRKIAKDGGISIGALIVGAMAKVLRHREPGNGPIPITVCVGVDLRRTVIPPVCPTETTHLVSPRNVLVSVDSEMNPIAVARDFKRELNNEIDTSIERLLTSSSANEISQYSSVEHLPRPLILLNNWGELPHFTHPEGLEIVDLTLQGMAEKKKINKPMSLSCKLTSYTFNKSLRIHILGPDQKIVKELRQQLLF